MRRRPRVLIIIATDAIGGPGKGLFQFLRHAPSDAFEYLLCNFDVKDRPDGEFIDEARRQNLNLVLLQQRATIDPTLVTQAIRIVRRHGIDVIQTHGHKPSVLGFALHHICGIPWVAYAHGYIHGGRRVRLYNWLDRVVLPYADRIVAVSGAVERSLVKNGVARDRVRLIYNAVETMADRDSVAASEVRTRLGLDLHVPLLGVIGRLSPEKGQLVFLKALQTLVRSRPDLKALLIGEGPDQPMLEEFCRRHGLQDAVLFTGYRENVGDYYRILDLVVLPSLTEGLPNTVLEAMSFGVPVVATEVGGVPEVIDADNGVLVPPGDHETLAAGILDLLQNDERRRTVGSNGRRSLYPRFAPDHRARQMVNVYHELLFGSTSLAHA